MSAPRRILVAVEPRLLGDALAELLMKIGLDDVVRPDDEHTGRIELALVSDDSPRVSADVVLRVPDADDLAHEGTGDLRPGSTADLLAILDRLCPAAEPRRDHLTQDLIAGRFRP